jgi:hypothetical protein
VYREETAGVTEQKRSGGLNNEFATTCILSQNMSRELSPTLHIQRSEGGDREAGGVSLQRQFDFQFFFCCPLCNTLP